MKKEFMVSRRESRETDIMDEKSITITYTELVLTSILRGLKIEVGELKGNMVGSCRI